MEGFRRDLVQNARIKVIDGVITEEEFHRLVPDWVLVPWGAVWHGEKKAKEEMAKDSGGK